MQVYTLTAAWGAHEPDCGASCDAAPRMSGRYFVWNLWIGLNLGTLQGFPIKGDAERREVLMRR